MLQRESKRTQEAGAVDEVETGDLKGEEGKASSLFLAWLDRSQCLTGLHPTQRTEYLRDLLE